MRILKMLGYFPDIHAFNIRHCSTDCRYRRIGFRRGGQKYYGFGKRYLYRSMYRMEKSIVAFGLEDFGFAVHDVSRWQTLSEETLPDYREELEHELQLEHA